MGIFEEMAVEMTALSESAMPDSVLFDVAGALVSDGKGGGTYGVTTTRGPFKARIRPIGSPVEQTFADQHEMESAEIVTVPRETEIAFKDRGTFTYADGRTFRLEAIPMPRSSYGPHRKAVVRRLRDDE